MSWLAWTALSVAALSAVFCLLTLWAGRRWHDVKHPDVAAVNDRWQAAFKGGRR